MEDEIVKVHAISTAVQVRPKTKTKIGIVGGAGRKRQSNFVPNIFCAVEEFLVKIVDQLPSIAAVGGEFKHQLIALTFLKTIPQFVPNHQIQIPPATGVNHFGYQVTGRRGGGTLNVGTVTAGTGRQVRTLNIPTVPHHAVPIGKTAALKILAPEFVGAGLRWRVV